MPKTKPSNNDSNKLTVRPLTGYLLVEPSTGETQTRSGIYLPDSAQEKPAQGKVVAVGEDILLPSGQALRSPVKVGDIVVYKKWGGDEIKVQGQEYKIVKFEDLMAIIEG